MSTPKLKILFVKKIKNFFKFQSYYIVLIFYKHKKNILSLSKIFALKYQKNAKVVKC